MSDRLATVNRVLRILVAGGRAEDVLDRVMDELLVAVDAERGYLVLGEDVCSVRNWSREEIDAEPGEVSRSIVRDVLQRGETLVLQDVLQSPFGAFESVQRLDLTSVIAAPLRFAGDDAIRGVLYLEGGQPSSPAAHAKLKNVTTARQFTEDDRALVETVLADCGQALDTIVARHEAASRARALESSLLARHRFPGIVTNEPAMLAALQTVAQVAPTEIPVMILGASGTGKELVARAVHLNSPRADGPFVPVNCGALAPELLESELFGHEAGAFTGAGSAREGLMAAAAGGTLFLDELGEMPAPLQVKLLRAVQFHEYKPVGSDRTRRVDVRFVSATNRDPEAAVRDGAFREDLLYRLNTVTIDLPPLRERIDDIPLLFDHVAQRICAAAQVPVPSVDPEVMAILVRHRWPGNVRELENEVARLLALGRGRAALTPDLLSARVRDAAVAADDPRSLAARLDAEERRAIEEALERENDNRTHAARRLGISRETLRVKMRKFTA